MRAFLASVGTTRAYKQRFVLAILGHLDPPMRTWRPTFAKDPAALESPSRVRSAAAGAVAAAVWGLQEPLDRRVAGCDYSDVAVLGKAVTSGRAWWPAGFAAHLVNGAVFGLAFHEARRRRPDHPTALAVGIALGEHVALYPLCYVVDRFHPRRGEPGIPPLLRNPRAFAQATWRHALFGVVLGRLA